MVRPAVIDAWMQHPTPGFLENPMFESLRRWGRLDGPPEIPLEMTVGALDAAGVSRGLLSAWWGPEGPLISNDEVAAAIQRFPDRFVGIASVDLARPMQ